MSKSSLKIYVASSLDNASRVKEIILELEKYGYNITYDWTKHGRVTDEKELIKIAQGEYRGVKDCDVFLMVHPARFGSHFEFGAAYALNKRIIILEETQIPELKSFYFLPSIETAKKLEDVTKRLYQINQLARIAQQINQTTN